MSSALHRYLKPEKSRMVVFPIINAEKYLCEEFLNKIQENVRMRSSKERADNLYRKLKSCPIQNWLQVKPKREAITISCNVIFDNFCDMKSYVKINPQAENYQREQFTLIEKEGKLADEIVPLLLSVPNFLDPETTLQIDEVTKTFLEPKSFEFKIQSHVKLAYINFGHHTSIVGPRSKFVVGEGAIIQQKLAKYFITNLRNCGFHMLSGMDFVKTGVVEACRGTTEEGWLNDPMIVTGYDGTLDNQMHHMVGEASLESIVAFLTKKFISPQAFPFKIASQGAKFTQSIEQINCIQCAVVTPSKVDDEYRQLIEMTWKLYQKLEIPLRLVTIGSKNLKNNESRRAEIQVYFPAAKTWKTCACISDHSDYTSHRIGKKFFMSEGMLVDSDIFLNSMMENNQLEDGTFKIPEILDAENLCIFSKEKEEN